MAESQIRERCVSDQIFTNLLASAYSVQERQDRLRGKISASKSDEVMSAVLDTQRLVWRHAIHPETAMQLIASRSQKIVGAAGAAIALLDGENLEYKVAIGTATRLLGAKILADASSCFLQLRSEPVVESSTWKDRALGARVVANSVLSMPLFRNGNLAGCLQLFSRVGQFGEDAVYVCEVMSAIVNQLLEESDSEIRDNEPGAALNGEELRKSEPHQDAPPDFNSAAAEQSGKASDVQGLPVGERRLKDKAVNLCVAIRNLILRRRTPQRHSKTRLVAP